ncbi:hypothetical protein WICMUC_005864 [Wickerhamomyces mucosus]|uniref:Protein SWT21 n=1 Tax=Wickerhamomyces mucosus TaxID=1378264 RepID=A0A9P8P2H0_9ASCO|nr:hypothetical protein WICMUC_005864 [Wickerhamomyces mucosus]
MFNFKVLQSSKSTFHNFGLSESIQLENDLQEKFINSNSNSEYTFPSFSNPNFISDTQFPNYIHRTKWLKDSSLITISQDNAIRLYIPSPDLLSLDNELILPYLRHFSSHSILTSEIHPNSSIYEGSIPVLLSSKEIPLKLMSLINGELITSYNNKNETVERYESVYSMKFLNEVNFLTGSNKNIKIYDLNRKDPIVTIENRGINSCITTLNSEFLERGSFITGTFSNKLTLYNSNCNIVQKFQCGNNGISQILESNNGKYLYIISRNSGKIKILDIRMSLKEVDQLSNLNFKNQRIYGDIFDNNQGLLIGSSNGELNWFKDSELGMSTTHEKIKLSDENSAISNVSINPSDANVIAISIGDRNSTKSELQIDKID